MVKFVSYFLIAVGLVVMTLGFGQAARFEANPGSDDNWALILLGLGLIACGPIILYFFDKKGEPQIPIRNHVKICPKCETVYEHIYDEHVPCSKCKIELEQLHGFYDRYPEKR